MIRHERNAWRRSVVLVSLVGGLLVAAPGYAQGAQDAHGKAGATPPPAAQRTMRDTAADTGVRAFDVVVLRPMQTAAVAVGVGIFVPSAILTSPGGRDTILEAWDLFVLMPSEEAFTRRLGDF